MGDTDAGTGKEPCVYVIAELPRFVKIGFSENVAKRLKDLQRSSPVPLGIYWIGYADNAAEVERQLHQHFRSKRGHGEWFELGPDAASLVAEAFGRIMADAVDVVKAKRAEKRGLYGEQEVWVIDCPHCGGEHSHGAEAGYRVPHCSEGHKEGEYLLIGPNDGRGRISARMPKAKADAIDGGGANSEP